MISVFDHFVLHEQVLSNLEKRITFLALALLAIFVLLLFVTKTIFHVKPSSKSFLQKPRNIEKEIEKNRDCARKQQEEEETKGFCITDAMIPDSLSIDKEGTLVEKPLFAENLTTTYCKVGRAYCEGYRESMEDADLVAEGEVVIGTVTIPFELFGLFDGHGGPHASAFVQANLFDYIKNALEKHRAPLTDESIYTSLEEAILKLDADYVESFEGTTATIALIIEGKIWVANVGDSRTILVKNGTATQASEDAKPYIPRYKKKIEKLGGQVLGKRVNGYLAVGTAIGDRAVVGKEGQCCVVANPKITHFPLDNFIGSTLILACDGLYDVATTDEVCKAVSLMESKNSEAFIAKSLVYHAIVHGSKDNVSVMVVRL